MTLPFKQFSFIRFLKSKSPRERQFIVAALGVVVLFLTVKLVIEPFYRSQRNVREEIPMKAQQLQKCRQFVSGRAQVEETLKRMQALAEKSYTQLLSGNTSPMAAASLQEILKTLSAKNLINIKSEKVLDSMRINSFEQIPVQIELNTTITNLTNFLYDIENHQKLLIVTDLNVRVSNYRDPRDVRATMVVAGLLKGKPTQPSGAPSAR